MKYVRREYPYQVLIYTFNIYDKAMMRKPYFPIACSFLFLYDCDMTRKEIANTLKRKRHFLKQIGEALKLVEDLDWRVAWALDFSEHSDINDALSPVGESLSNAQEELEQLQD